MALTEKMCLMIETPYLYYRLTRVWYKRTGDLKVRDWIEKTASWVKAGYVSPDVWLGLKRRVRSDVLCNYIETASVQKKPEDGASDCKTYLIFSGNN